MSVDSTAYAHPTAQVHPESAVGAGTRIWDWAKVREGAQIGRNCNIGQGCYVDSGAVIGDGCKIQNFVSVYNGVVIGDRVFVGPHATFTNDRLPRAFGTWSLASTEVEEGASIGANATIVCGKRLGAYCMVAAGAVVTHDVPPHALVAGNPARVIDYVTRTGARVGWTPGQPAPTSSRLNDE